jgi:hypothetical protein
VTYFFLNPGSGPISRRVTMKQALVNMKHLIKDAEVPNATFESDKNADEDDGRFDFVVRLGKKKVFVSIPGLPLKDVRFDPNNKNCLFYPRLYINGSSWYWKYAVSQVHFTLTGDENWEWDGCP